MKISTKLLNSLFFLFLLTLGLYSCKKTDNSEVVKGEAKVKMINAVQTESNQGILIDGQQLSMVSLAFGETTSYMKIASGNRNVSFVGSSNIPTTAALNFTPSITYTTFLINDRNGVRDVVNYEDNLSNTEMGKAKLKLINLTPYFTTGINVSVQAGTQFVNSLLFKETSTYFTVDAGTNLRYNVVGSSSIKTIDGTSLEGGKIYTIWFSGITAAAIEAHVVADN